MPPDAVLLHRELRWTTATMLALSAIGHAAAGAYGATLGAGIGFLLQQTCYKLMVAALWRGWHTRFIAHEGAARARQHCHLSLRAFTLWVRTATAGDRLHVALWNGRNDEVEHGDDINDSATEIRIRHTYSVALKLGNEPVWCDNPHRRRLRHSLQRDERRLLRLATGRRFDD